jgi:hypothetical protein
MLRPEIDLQLWTQVEINSAWETIGDNINI